MSRTNESGYTLISVLIIFVLFTIIGVSLTTMSLSSVKASQTKQHYQSAFYIAEAGLNYKLNEIEEKLTAEPIQTAQDWQDLLNEINELSILSFDDETNLRLLQFPANQETYADIHVQPLPESGEYAFAIESQGFVSDKTRTVQQTFTLNIKESEQEQPSVDAPPYAIYTSGDLTISGGEIQGDIATQSKDKNSVKFPGGWPTFKGDIYVPDGDKSIVSIKTGAVTSDVKKLPDEQQIPSLPTFPEIPEYPRASESNISLVGGPENSREIVLTESQSFDKIYIGPGLTLTLNLGDMDREIVIDHLELNSGKLNIEGTGNLTIYVNNIFKMNASSTIESKVHESPIKNISQINIFYKGNGIAERLIFNSDQKLRASLYARDAEIIFGASAQISGNLFTGGKYLEINGGSINNTQLFFAPQARVKIGGGGTVNGSIIAKEAEISGWGTVKHQPNLEEYITGPISISPDQTKPGNGNGTPSLPSDPDEISIKATNHLREIDS